MRHGAGVVDGSAVDALDRHGGGTGLIVVLVLQDVVDTVAELGVAERHTDLIDGKHGRQGIGVDARGGLDHGVGDVHELHGLAQADLCGGHEDRRLVGHRIGTVEAEVLGGHGLVKLGELPAVVIGPGALGRNLPALPVIAVLNTVAGHDAIDAAGLTRQVAQGVDLGCLGKLHLDPEVLTVGPRPSGVIDGVVLAVEGQARRALVRATGRLHAAGAWRNLAHRIVARGVLGARAGGLHAQVDGKGVAGEMVLGLDDDEGLAVLRRQHGHGRVVGTHGLDAVLGDHSRRGVELAGRKRVGVDLLAVHRECGELGGGVGDKGAGDGDELNLGDADARLVVRLGLGGVGHRNANLSASRGGKVIGVAPRRAAALARDVLGDRLGCLDRRPRAAVRGNLELGGTSGGIVGAPVVVNKVDLDLAHDVGGVEHHGHLGLGAAVLSIVVVGPDVGVVLCALMLGLEGGGAVDQRHQGVGGVRGRLGVLIHALEGGVGGQGEVAAEGVLGVLDADGCRHGHVGAKDVGRTSERNGLLLLVDLLGVVVIPGHGEVGVDDGAAGHGARTRVRKLNLAAHLDGGGVIENGGDVVHHGHDSGNACALDLALNLKGAGLGKKVLGDRSPGDGRGVAYGAVGVVDGHGLGQAQLRAGLHIVVAREEQALHALLGRLLARGLGVDGDRGAVEVVGGHLDGDGVAGLVGAHDAHELAGPRVAVVVAVGLPVGGAAVVHSRELAAAGDLKLHVVGGVGDDAALGVGHAHGDVGEVDAVGRDGLTVNGGRELGGLAGGGHALAAVPALGVELGTVGIVGLGRDGAVLVRDVPGEVQAGVAVGVGRVDLVAVVLGGHGLEGLLAKGLGLAAVCGREEELNLRGVGVDDHGDVSVVAGILVDDVLVPRREDVQRVDVIVPLALIEVVGVLGQAGGVHDAEVGVLGAGPLGAAVAQAGAGAVPGRGLAEVVKAGPHVLAHDEVIANGVVPRLRGEVAPAHARDVIGGQLLAGGGRRVVEHVAVDATAVGGRDGLGAVHLPVGVCAVKALIAAADGIVEADDAAEVGEDLRLVVHAAAQELVVAEGGRTRGVGALDPVDEVLQHGAKVGLEAGEAARGAVDHLVANGPHDDGGGVDVTRDGLLDVVLCPRLVGVVAHEIGLAHGLAEETTVVVGVAVLALVPAVEDFLVHEHALLLADLDEGAGGRIVRGADGVATHLLEDAHLALDGGAGVHGAEGALVVVHADAMDLEVLTVEVEAVIGGVLNPAIAEGGVVGVHDLAVDDDLGAGHVEVGVVGIPESGVGSLDRSGKGGGLAGSNALLGGGGADGLAALGGQHRLLDGDGNVRVAVVGDRGLEVGGHGRAGCVLGLKVGRGDDNAVLLDVHRIGDHEVDVAANAGAGVPAGGRDLVVNAHGDDVLAAKVDKVGNVKREGRVAVGVGSQLLAVDVDRGIHVDAVKVDEDGLALEVLAHLKALAIPAHTAGLVGALALARLDVVLVDGVVMRNVDVLPGGVIVGRLLSARGLAEVELPVLVEVLRALLGVAHGVHVEGLRGGGHLRGARGAQRGIERGAHGGHGERERTEKDGAQHRAAGNLSARAFC